MRKFENKVYMLSCVFGAQMNSFIITTEEGGLIVIDGGWREDGEKLLGKLREITGEDVPHIDAWWLSHCHSDHFCAFMELIEKHRSEFSFDKIYYNFPSVQFTSLGSKVDGEVLAKFYEDTVFFADKINIVTQGDKYSIKGADFDILYTTDPVFVNNPINDSSTVFAMTLAGKRFMFLGDLGPEAGEKLLSMHGKNLKSDYCQMAHHGQLGVQKSVYEAILPEICLWCTPLWLWNNDAGKGFNTHVWKTVEVRGWMEELGVKENITLKDGDTEFVVK